MTNYILVAIIVIVKEGDRLQKSVYSIVLMDEVVAAVDRLAYEAGTSRSNMMNRILAEYTQVDTPENRIQDIFTLLGDLVTRNTIFKPIASDSDTLLGIKTALQYKYNPSVKYVFEIYPHKGEMLGELRVGMRTQNAVLISAMNQFFVLWDRLENHSLPCPPKRQIQNERYVRIFRNPEHIRNNQELASLLSDYIKLFDHCLKEHFNCLQKGEHSDAHIEAIYKRHLTHNLKSL